MQGLGFSCIMSLYIYNHITRNLVSIQETSLMGPMQGKQLVRRFILDKTRRTRICNDTLPIAKGMKPSISLGTAQFGLNYVITNEKGKVTNKR